MPEQDPAPATSLQFDKAEYSAPQEIVSNCRVCHRPIAQTYYTVNAAMVCEECRGKLEASAARGSRLTRAFAAAALGLLAGLAGAGLWYAVRTISGYEVGLIAIVVGLMVGAAVRKGSSGRGGWFYQTLAIVLTYSCICAEYMPDIVGGFMRKYRETHSAPARPASDPNPGEAAAKMAAEHDGAENARPVHAPVPKPGTVKLVILLAMFLLIAFIISLAVPFLGGLRNVIGLLLIGIALYEAWKINKRSPLRIAGPFQLASTVTSEAPRV